MQATFERIAERIIGPKVVDLVKSNRCKVDIQNYRGIQ